MSDERLRKLGDLMAIEDRSVAAGPAVERLRALLGDPDAEVRAPAAALAGRYPGEDALVARVLELGRSDPEPEVRMRALEGLADVVAAGELAGAEGKAYDPDPTLGEPCAERYQEARQALLKALEAEDGALRSAALLGLAPLAQHLESVERAIDEGLSGTPAARALSLQAVSRSGGRRWREAIERGLQDSEGAVARAAAQAAACAELTDLADSVATLLAEGPPLARAVAAPALGRLAGREAAAALLTAAERDPEATVRQAARLALSDLGLFDE